MPKLKPGTVFPTAEEDAKIYAAVADDEDSMLLEDPQLKLAPLKKRGRPQKAQPKIAVSVRYTPEVISAFKASGAGWQTRMDVALQDWLKTHQPAEIKL